MLDFDGVITNSRFVKNLWYIIDGKIKIKIVTANRSANIKKYFQEKAKIPIDGKDIFVSQKGKKGKIQLLKQIAIKYHKNPILYFDNEEDYLEYGKIMLMHPFLISKNGKWKKVTNFK